MKTKTMTEEEIFMECLSDKEHICCICDKHFEGIAYDADPVEKGVCCSECFAEKVIQPRIKKVLDMF